MVILKKRHENAVIIMIYLHLRVNPLSLLRPKHQIDRPTRTVYFSSPAKAGNNWAIFLSDYIKQHSTECQFEGGGSWTILSDIEQRIKAKIEAVGVPLKDWDIKINRGVLTGCNEAFIIDGAKKIV